MRIGGRGPGTSPGSVSVACLLLPRRHGPHPVDLVSGRVVLDAVADAPDSAQAPLEEVSGVFVDELLRLRVDLRPALVAERRAPLDDQVVQRLVAFDAVRLVARL